MSPLDDPNANKPQPVEQHIDTPSDAASGDASVAKVAAAPTNEKDMKQTLADGKAAQPKDTGTVDQGASQPLEIVSDGQVVATSGQNGADATDNGPSTPVDTAVSTTGNGDKAAKTGAEAATAGESPSLINGLDPNDAVSRQVLIAQGFLNADGSIPTATTEAQRMAAAIKVANGDGTGGNQDVGDSTSLLHTRSLAAPETGDTRTSIYLNQMQPKPGMYNPVTGPGFAELTPGEAVQAGLISDGKGSQFSENLDVDTRNLVSQTTKDGIQTFNYSGELDTSTFGNDQTFTATESLDSQGRLNSRDIKYGEDGLDVTFDTPDGPKKIEGVKEIQTRYDAKQDKYISVITDRAGNEYEATTQTDGDVEGFKQTQKFTAIAGGNGEHGVWTDTATGAVNKITDESGTWERGEGPAMQAWTKVGPDGQPVAGADGQPITKMGEYQVGADQSIKWTDNATGQKFTTQTDGTVIREIPGSGSTSGYKVTTKPDGTVSLKEDNIFSIGYSTKPGFLEGNLAASGDNLSWTNTFGDKMSMDKDGNVTTELPNVGTVKQERQPDGTIRATEVTIPPGSKIGANDDMAGTWTRGADGTWTRADGTKMTGDFALTNSWNGELTVTNGDFKGQYTRDGASVESSRADTNEVNAGRLSGDKLPDDASVSRVVSTDTAGMERTTWQVKNADGSSYVARFDDQTGSWVRQGGSESDQWVKVDKESGLPIDTKTGKGVEVQDKDGTLVNKETGEPIALDKFFGNVETSRDSRTLTVTDSDNNQSKTFYADGSWHMTLSSRDIKVEGDKIVDQTTPEYEISKSASGAYAVTDRTSGKTYSTSSGIEANKVTRDPETGALSFTNEDGNKVTIGMDGSRSVEGPSGGFKTDAGGRMVSQTDETGTVTNRYHYSKDESGRIQLDQFQNSTGLWNLKNPDRAAGETQIWQRSGDGTELKGDAFINRSNDVVFQVQTENGTKTEINKTDGTVITETRETVDGQNVTTVEVGQKVGKDMVPAYSSREVRDADNNLVEKVLESSAGNFKTTDGKTWQQVDKDGRPIADSEPFVGDIKIATEPGSMKGPDGSNIWYTAGSLIKTSYQTDKNTGELPKDANGKDIYTAREVTVVNSTGSSLQYLESGARVSRDAAGNINYTRDANDNYNFFNYTTVDGKRVLTGLTQEDPYGDTIAEWKWNSEKDASGKEIGGYFTNADGTKSFSQLRVNNNGELVENATDAKGKTTEITHQLDGGMKYKTSDGVVVVKDQAGRVTSYTSQNKETYSITYDASGNISRFDGPNQTIVTDKYPVSEDNPLPGNAVKADNINIVNDGGKYKISYDRSSDGHRIDSYFTGNQIESAKINGKYQVVGTRDAAGNQITIERGDNGDVLKATTTQPGKDGQPGHSATVVSKDYKGEIPEGAMVADGKINIDGSQDSRSISFTSGNKITLEANGAEVHRAG
ncbi:MAG: hypothetical protein KC777_13465, partial [Cyanobacteria bacterium HKST-UBA02]|nr:hypothetical protein [Cyanobacteria bacterium HKST-UBA02]